MNYLAETPIITGFYVTTNMYPDGTGEVIGNPAYTIKDINIFPNPYSDKLDGENLYERFVIFSHLPPGEVTIIIVKGLSKQESMTPPTSYLGISAFRTGIAKIKTIQKNDSSRFCRWDLRDENQQVVSEGFYRAYLFGEGIPDNYFLDLSITLILNYIQRF